MLLFKEFVPRAPEQGFIRVDHGFDCEGSSSALRIERTKDGGIKAYCFRCNESGYYRTKDTNLAYLKRRFTESTEELKQKNFALSPHLTSNLLYYSVEALRWLNKYNIKPSEIEQHSILFHPEINRLVFPVYSNDELLFFQYRRLIEDGFPKYISYQKYKNRPYGKFIDNGTEDVVIVEDVLSAVKC